MRDVGAVGACLFLATAALFFTAPIAGDFWWSDAPRHAMDGLFIRDLILAHPVHDPAGWAVAYYLRHPAITVLFYPPLFPAVEAVFFLVFGASHACAQLTVCCFTLLLAAASYGVARMMMPALAATGCALLVIGAPETALWGRQVMLDIPAYALSVAAGFSFLRYLQTDRIRFLYGALLAFDASIYTKYNAAILAPAFVVAYLCRYPWQVWRRKDVVWALGLAAVGLLPAVFLFLKFGQVNVQSVTGVGSLLPPGGGGRFLYYAAQLPGQLGWAPLVPAILGLFFLARFGRRWLGVFLIVWLASAYVAFSLISLKSSRFDLPVLFPLSLAAGVALCRVVPPRISGVAMLALGAGVLGDSVFFQDVPHVDGYRQVALWLGARAPANALVLYDGYRDGNLVFDLMTSASRPDIAVVRADKLMLSVPVGERNTRGVAQRAVDPAKLVSRVAPDFIVVQPGFWADLQNMAAFEAAVAPPAYRAVAAFSITGQLSGQDGKQGVVIYQPVVPPVHGSAALSVDMPDIGRHFDGALH
jgi:hypothetical protein